MKNVFFCVLLVLASCAFSLGQTYKVLWSFGGAPNDGANPISDFVFDSSGNMYGTTQWGGSSTNISCGYGVTPGCGTVFELSSNSDGTWTETVLYNFCANYPTGEVCLDGQGPMAGLAMDSLGNLYGTTYLGGITCAYASAGCGTVFELSPPQQPGGSWTETTLYMFCSVYENFECLDGAEPTSHLTFDAEGNLYGTTTGGGSGHWFGGTVFELSPPSQPGGQWTEAVLYSFCVNGKTSHCPDGTEPLAGITFDNVGNLYGTTEWGGTPSGGGLGTVYELSPGSSGWTFTELFGFNPAGGEAGPRGVVNFDAAGNIYSTAYYGGPADFGGVFRINRANGLVRAVYFNGDDGGGPTAGVVVDQRTGTIYGTNTLGRTGEPGGAVFEIGKDGKLTVLYTFCQQTNCADGAVPAASLTSHSSSLYGTTEYGGIGGSPFGGGNGVVFEITP